MLSKEKNYYKTRFKFDPGRQKIWQAITEYLQPFVGKNKAVLDLGSGYADFINLVEAKKKYAVDVNPASKKYLEDGIVFINSTSDSLGKIKDNSLDVVFSSNLLEHLDRDQFDKTMKELSRCLNKNGIMIAIQPNYRYAYKNYFDDYTHKGIFTHISLADVMDEYGLEPIKVVPRFLPLTLKSRLPKSYLLTKLYLMLPISPMGKQMLLIFRVKNIKD